MDHPITITHAGYRITLQMPAGVWCTEFDGDVLHDDSLQNLRERLTKLVAKRDAQSRTTLAPVTLWLYYRTPGRGFDGGHTFAPVTIKGIQAGRTDPTLRTDQGPIECGSYDPVYAVPDVDARIAHVQAALASYTQAQQALNTAREQLTGILKTLHRVTFPPCRTKEEAMEAEPEVLAQLRALAEPEAQ